MLESNLTANETGHHKSDDETEAYFIAYVSEERGGRRIPGAPIKIMGSQPEILGEQLGKLIRRRYPQVMRETLESMGRTKLITLELKSSYLLIRLELPPEHIRCPRRTTAFSRFVIGIKTALAVQDTVDSMLRRRRKPDLAIC